MSTLFCPDCGGQCKPDDPRCRECKFPLKIEVIAEGGVIVDEAEDADGFAAALDTLDDDATRAQLGASARSAVDKLGWDAHVTALRALFGSLRS